MNPERPVLILIRPAFANVALVREALRGAVALAAGGAPPQVLLCDGAVGALDDTEVDKALRMLEALGHPVRVLKETLEAREVSAPDGLVVLPRSELGGLLEACQLFESWG